MDAAAAQRFVDAWVTAWNAHDVEAVLAHFTDDVVFSSPVAEQVAPGSGGVLRGKIALRDYWTTALQRIPELHFQVLGSYVGVNTLVIHYRNQRGVLVNEVLSLRGDLVSAGHGTYRSTQAQSATPDVGLSRPGD
jgi:hypothetical protein